MTARVVDHRTKQQKFVAEYLVDLNATQAAIRCGYSRKTARQTGAGGKNKFYVYALVDPRNDRAFYVGKGCGRRASSHSVSVASRSHANPLLSARIGEIHAEGSEVGVSIIWSGLSEPEALTRERLLITRIGLTRLANIAPGNLSRPERQMLRARALNASPTFPAWLAEAIDDMSRGERLTPESLQNGDRQIADSYTDGSWRSIEKVNSDHGR